MRYVRIALIGALLASAVPVASAQRFSYSHRNGYGYDSRASRDLREDYRRLDYLERRVQDDEWRLRDDRARRAPGFIIRQDKDRLKYDRRALDALRRDIRRAERGYR